MSSTVDAMLRRQARDIPDKTFLRFAGGDLSYLEVDAASDSIARGLAHLGVGRGDPVAMLLPNCPEFIALWFAANKLGAVAAPLNIAFRGPVLTHMLNVSRAQVLVVDAGLLDAVRSIVEDLTFLEHMVVRSDSKVDADALPSATTVSFDTLRAETGKHPEINCGSDLAILLPTSGTTGRSKACALSHRYAVRQAELLIENYGLTQDDVLYCPFPLFHLDAAVLTVMPALVLGAVAAIGERFSVSGFWNEVRAFGATVFDFMGATLTLLYKVPQESAIDDRDNLVRLAWGVPIPEFAEAFESRFGLQLVELYGSTDAGVPVYQPLHEPRRRGACGRPIPSYDVRLFDAEDNEVGVGAVGEIVIRPNEPDLIASGYFGMPEETNRARRNLWFHTGDLARFDEDGFLYFVGRLKDVIRRRGENISAFEVEEVVKGHPDVLDVAAYGVPSDLTEEEVMIAVVPRSGQTISNESLVGYCKDKMAGYMVPRYIDIVDLLPRTPTEKVEKHVLIQRGITPTTWDRERNVQPELGSSP